MMKYFENCKTVDEVKALYRNLAKELHPDCGGSTELMQELNNEYVFVCQLLLQDLHKSSDKFNEQMDLSEKHRSIIEQIAHLDGIRIELIGQWIWVTGDTYQIKDLLKTSGLFYSSQKTAWYYRPEGYKGKKSDKSLEEIRDKYGSEKINFRKPGTFLQ
jgi:curved DNA-binding protein CbpA